MNSNDELVDYLVEKGYIESKRVEKAFRNVDREKFVPEEYAEQAYSDRPLSIGEEATISAPHMVAINTELLKPGGGDRVLEIGSESGYQAAVLSEIAESVTGVEVVGELVEESREALSGRENVEIVHGSGFEEVEGKFDRILYSCAVESFEKAEEYLEKGGVAVAPIKTGASQTLQKLEGSQITSHGKVRFVSFRD